MSARIYIGTSGFYYDHWRGMFYPPDLPKSRFFEHYTRAFDTVELNSTFYHLPRLKTTEHWAEASPPDFRFALKAYRGITHYARLENAGDELYRFLHLVKPLKPKLGAILFQLPPSLRKDLPLLEDFLALLPPGYRFVFEFRHPSWEDEAVYEALKSANAAWCLNDFGKRPMGSVITADFSYLRFHGPTGRYGGRYDEAALKECAEWIAGAATELKALFVYFNNDEKGYAVEDAGRLREMVRERLEYNSQKDE
ncbi:DUF72 domain-containing protein [Hydrogenimonas sp.]